jgi:hypothetical protein
MKDHRQPKVAWVFGTDNKELLAENRPVFIMFMLLASDRTSGHPLPLRFQNTGT